MKDALLRVISNPNVRKAFVAFILALFAALGIGFQVGCGGSALPPAVAKARAVLECQIAVLESVVPRSVAEDLVMAARAGNGEYVIKQLLGLGLTPEDIRRASDEFGMCSADAPDAGAPPVTVEQG